MSYSVTAIYWHYKKNRKDLYPIKILVTVNGKGTPIHTPHKVSPAQWDNELREVVNHPNAKYINADIGRRITDKEGELMVADRVGEKLTMDLIKGIQRDRTLIGFAREVGRKKIHKKTGEKVLDPIIVCEINRVIAYCGTDLNLSDVDVTWLRKFDDSESRRGMSQNTRNGTFSWLRSVYKQAKKENLIRENPFDRWKIPAYADTDPVYLVEPEKDALLKLIPGMLKGEPMYNTLLYFLGGCYSGLRQSDWHKLLEKDRVHNGFLRLRTQKKSKGYVVMPVGKTLAKVLQMIYDLNEPPHEYRHILDHLRDLFRLAGIKKDSGTHVGRHSFGYLCASMGLPKSTAAALMGISVETVEVYYHLTGENIMKQAAALAEV